MAPRRRVSRESLLRAQPDRHHAAPRLSIPHSRPLVHVLQLATIAIGVGGLSAVFAVVGAVVLRPLPFDEPEELVTIDVTSSRGFSISTSIPNYRDWSDRNRTLAAYGGSLRLELPADERHRDAASSTAVPSIGDLFGVLRVKSGAWSRVPVERNGAGFTTARDAGPLDVADRNSPADSSIVGRSITLDGTPHTVTGVLPHDFAFPRTEPAVLVNMGSIDGSPVG